MTSNVMVQVDLFYILFFVFAIRGNGKILELFTCARAPARAPKDAPERGPTLCTRSARALERVRMKYFQLQLSAN